MAGPLATVGILSIGEMGLGVARLLSAHNYRVITNVSDRSQSTHRRAQSASIQLLPSDQELAAQSDYILSIVPPRDALGTAQRIVSAAKEAPRAQNTPLYYIDLNAISPRSATEIAHLFSPTPIRFIDGGIIGGPPKLTTSDDSSWTKPSLVVSGPDKLQEAPVNGLNFAEVLNLKHIADTIGPGTGLKMCFASTTKGFTAIAIQSFTTAHALGVLPDLQSHLKDYSPKSGELAARGLVGMPHKAYRWVREMEEIADTFSESGGFDRDLFHGVSEVYKTVAEHTELGRQSMTKEKDGLTPEKVAQLMNEGMKDTAHKQ